MTVDKVTIDIEEYARLRDLQAAVKDYLEEKDNPAPDPMYRNTLLDRVRAKVGE